MNNIFIKEETNEKVVAIQWNGYNTDAFAEAFNGDRVRILCGPMNTTRESNEQFSHKVNLYKLRAIEYTDINGDKQDIKYYDWLVRYVNSGNLEVYTDNEFRKVFYKK